MNIFKKFILFIKNKLNTKNAKFLPEAEHTVTTNTILPNASPSHTASTNSMAYNENTNSIPHTSLNTAQNNNLNSFQNHVRNNITDERTIFLNSLKVQIPQKQRVFKRGVKTLTCAGDGLGIQKNMSY